MPFPAHDSILLIRAIDFLNLVLEFLYFLLFISLFHDADKYYILLSHKSYCHLSSIFHIKICCSNINAFCCFLLNTVNNSNVQIQCKFFSRFKPSSINPIRFTFRILHTSQNIRNSRFVWKIESTFIERQFVIMLIVGEAIVINYFFLIFLKIFSNLRIIWK